MTDRIASAQLHRLLGYYPVVAITGPRQSGKTTLARSALPAKPYASMEDGDVREFATRDPRAFLDQYPDGAVLDEIQRAPELSSWLQSRVDRDGRTGLFVLTGSQQLGVMDRVSQSLAGRVGLLQLLPFSWSEIRPANEATPLEEVLWRGFYPPIHDRGIPPGIWFADYFATYVERDVRQLVNVRDLLAFRRFVLLCAARSGQLLNLSALAADCGITHNTAGAWLSVLEASFLVVRLEPFHANVGKRLTKSPKLYFLDAGFAAWMAGAREPRDLVTGAMRGPIFETFVVTEFLKHARNRLGQERHFFWRDRAGVEVDLVVDAGARKGLVELKSGTTIASDWSATIGKVGPLVGNAWSAVVYGGSEVQLTRDVPVVGWRDIDRVLARVEGGPGDEG